jgi:hypothetical protein
MSKSPPNGEAKKFKDIILEALADSYAEVLNPRFDRLEETTGTIQVDLAEMKSDIRDIHRRVKDVAWDTPTRQEHEALKHQVEGLAHQSQY